MGSRDTSSIRAYPRAFIPGLPDPLPDVIDLPAEEHKKFANVLRLKSGYKVVILPNDGRAVLCTLQGKTVVPMETERPNTDSPLELTLALGIPKPDSLELAVRMASEIGVSHFCLFQSDRTVVKWDEDKWAKRLHRLEVIAREASEVCFRTKLPTFSVRKDLAEVLQTYPEATVLSEVEGIPRPFPKLESKATIVIGPEGGWAPRELELIGDRGVTLGPRVFRVSTAVAAACSLALCEK